MTWGYLGPHWFHSFLLHFKTNLFFMSLKHFHFNILDISKNSLEWYFVQSSRSKTLLHPWQTPCSNEVQIFDIFWLLTFSVSSITSRWFAVPVWTKITCYKFIIIFFGHLLFHMIHTIQLLPDQTLLLYR